MSYSNPGYAVAGYLIEKVTGEKYEDRIAEKIFKPAGMPTSSFVLTKEDEAILAKGYRDRTGPPVPYTQIYLRPAGNLHTSALELGRWVHLLLNWGETENDLVIDPEYLSNMEHPRTTVASFAGLRNGYGSGIASSEVEGFPMLGHGGGIEGFVSSYAYSTSRDVGYVILLNSTHSPRGDAAHREARGPLSQGRCRAAAQAESDGRRGDASKIRGLLPRRQPAQSGDRVRRMAVVGTERQRQRRSPGDDAGVRQRRCR